MINAYINNLEYGFLFYKNVRFSTQVFLILQYEFDSGFIDTSFKFYMSFIWLITTHSSYNFQWNLCSSIKKIRKLENPYNSNGS